MLRTTRFYSSASLALLLTMLGGMTSSAYAQMNNTPFGFEPRNRTSIAAMMQQVEEQNGSGGSGLANITSSTTTLVCGSDGDSSAQGNSSCVILNNANADLEMGQDAQGDQSANADNSSGGTVDDVMDALGTEDLTNTSR